MFVTSVLLFLVAGSTASTATEVPLDTVRREKAADIGRRDTQIRRTDPLNLLELLVAKPDQPQVLHEPPATSEDQTFHNGQHGQVLRESPATTEEQTFANGQRDPRILRTPDPSPQKGDQQLMPLVRGRPPPNCPAEGQQGSAGWLSPADTVVRRTASSPKASAFIGPLLPKDEGLNDSETSQGSLDECEVGWDLGYSNGPTLHDDMDTVGIDPAPANADSLVGAGKNDAEAKAEAEVEAETETYAEATAKADVMRTPDAHAAQVVDETEPQASVAVLAEDEDASLHENKDVALAETFVEETSGKLVAGDMDLSQMLACFVCFFSGCVVYKLIMKPLQRTLVPPVQP